MATVQSRPSWLALAEHVERLGFFALHLGDHAGAPPPLPPLVAAAEVTTRLRMGTRVLNAGVSTIERMASDVATADLLTGGRFELGVGAGWHPADFAAVGQRMPPLTERASRLEAVLGGVRDHLGDRERPWRDMLVQRPRPPIAVGGQSRAVLAVAARQADIVELTGTKTTTAGPHAAAFEHARQCVEYLESSALERFARMEIGVRVHVVMVGGPAVSAARILAAATGLPAQSILDSPFALIGTVAEVVDKVWTMSERLGITRYSVGETDIGELAPVVRGLASDRDI